MLNTSMIAAREANIRPTDAPVVRAMLEVDPGSASGWRLREVAIERDRIRAVYSHPVGSIAEVSLGPRGGKATAGPHTEKFDVAVRAHRDAPGLRALVSAVVLRVRSEEPRLGRSDGALSREDEEALHEEINFHLEWCPYLDLGFAFDHATCLRESLVHRDRFVIRHERNPGWRALALKAPGGDANCNITYDTHGEPLSSFALTDVAATCPTVITSLDRIVDVSQARIILLFLLEPGASIAPHFDDRRNPVLRSLNIAFNMPVGCVFRLGLDEAGHAGPRTVTAPFEDGSAMLLNVATCHDVVNDSSEHRVHVYVKGEVRMRTDTLLARARAQNGIGSRAEIVRALAARREQDGIPVAPDEPLARHLRAFAAGT
jgi:hypothetical protein